MDTLVFDIETKNFFTSPDVGWDNFDALRISVVGVYSYAANRYFCYTEHETEALAELFKGASRIVGFSINRYDIPVLQGHFTRLGHGIDLNEKEKIDLLDDIKQRMGSRISLEKLSQANLGTGKTGHGAHAIELYNEGKIEELKEYCLKDVELTKALYDLSTTRGYFYIPDRETGALSKLHLKDSHEEISYLS